MGFGFGFGFGLGLGGTLARPAISRGLLPGIRLAILVHGGATVRRPDSALGRARARV